MSLITIEFEDKQLAQLKEKAKNMQFASVEELLQKIAMEMLAPVENNDFDLVIKRVLAKNKELYMRLA